jgi:hypothetical protein
MSDFLKELNNLYVPPKPKVHTVKIQGQNVVVTLEKKLEVMQHGEDAYMWKSATEFVLRPKPIYKASYPVLKKSTKGYGFLDNDIHWPNAVVDGGETWQR